MISRFLNKKFIPFVLILHFSINGSSSEQISSETPLDSSNQISIENTSKSKSLHGLFTMRLKAGFNLATWWGASPSIDKKTGETVAPYKNRILLPGFTTGAGLELRLLKYFSIQPEILFTLKGYKTKKTVNNNNQSETIKETTRLKYLEFPILIKFTLPFSRGYTHIFSGPVFGIKTGFSSYINRNLNEKKYTETIPESVIKIMEEGFEDNDFGVVMGIGLDIAKGTDLFILDIRYTLGLKEITKLSASMISEGLTEKNFFKHKSNSISLNIGYALIF